MIQKNPSRRQKEQERQRVLSQSFTDISPISQSGSLVDHFLVASPSIEDSIFSGSVVYVWDHDKEGALGLIINRSTDITVSDLASKLKLSVTEEAHKTDKVPVFFGGPVQSERGIVLHEEEKDAPAFLSTQVIKGGLCLTSTFDVLESALQGKGPDNWMVALGYAGWHAGQLEEEIANDNWLVVSANRKLMFSTPAPLRYAAALKLLGINVFQLSSEAGHA